MKFKLPSSTSWSSVRISTMFGFCWRGPKAPVTPLFCWALTIVRNNKHKKLMVCITDFWYQNKSSMNYRLLWLDFCGGFWISSLDAYRCFGVITGGATDNRLSGGIKDTVKSRAFHFLSRILLNWIVCSTLGLRFLKKKMRNESFEVWVFQIWIIVYIFYFGTIRSEVVSRYRQVYRFMNIKIFSA